MVRPILALTVLVGACASPEPELGGDSPLPDDSATADAALDAQVLEDGGLVDGPPIDAVEPAWRFRRTLTIDNTGQGELARFALAVLLDPSRIDYAKVGPGGADLRFGDATGNFYAHEIERWAPGGKSVVWVHVPTIADNATTELYLYYGNANAPDGQMPAAVWNAEYVGVWHLADAHDSLGVNASVNLGTTAAEGSFGPARDFSGNGQYIDTLNATQLGTSYTIEAWIHPDTGPSTGPFSAPVGRFPNYLILWNCSTAAYCRTALHNIITPQGNEQTFSSAYTPAAVNTWSYVVARWNGTSLRTFVNGVSQPNTTTTGSPITTATTAKIGARGDIAGFFDGQIEEVRISRNARSDDYIRAHHKAETNTYITIWGDEEPNPNP